jgi:NAD(P)-dependent dehydrogenase (short-subunit alcohol dehydrogenase family)
LAFFKSVHERHGHIDIVVVNAGIVERREFLDEVTTSDGELAAPDISVLNVNLIGCMYTGKLALWWFKKNPTPGGALVMISSVGGYSDGINLIPPLMAGKGITMYKASKHGVIGYLRGLKHYMPEANAHVTAIAPWMTKTYFRDLLD